MDDEHFMCLLRNGQILAFPAGILGFLKTRALGAREKLDVARLFIMALIRGSREAFVRTSLLMKFDGIPLSDYCRQRFARSTLDDVLHPMIAMTMGTPEDVSLLLAVTMLSVVDEKHFVLRHGNGTLPMRLAELCPPIRTETPVRRIVIDGGRVRGVELESGEGMLGADIVVCATNAHEAAEILPDLGEQQLRVLRRLPTAAVCRFFWPPRSRSCTAGGWVFPEHGHVPDLHHGGDLQEQAQGSAGTRLDPGVHHWGRGQEQDVTGGRRDRRTGTRGDTKTASGLSGAHHPHGVIRREEAMALSGPGYQKKLIGLNESLEQIRGLYLIGDYQTFPTIEGACTWERRRRRASSGNTCRGRTPPPRGRPPSPHFSPARYCGRR